MVPIVSKKSLSSREKTSSSRPSTAPGPAAPVNAPNMSGSGRPKVGVWKSVSIGTFNFQPVGLTSLPAASNMPPVLVSASTMTASTVPARIAISIAPLTRRT